MEAHEPICYYCKRIPSELEEYTVEAAECNITPDEYVRREEGTYNPESGHFACTDCYCKIGMPSLPGGWRAP